MGEIVDLSLRERSTMGGEELAWRLRLHRPFSWVSTSRRRRQPPNRPSAPVPVARTPLTLAEGPEYVVVAGGGVVLGDNRQQVGARGPAQRDVEAAADALAVTAA